MGIVEINKNNRHLSLFRGFLRISENGEKLKDLPLDAIETLLVSGSGITYSHNILVSCTERKIPLVICGKNYHPAGILMPVVGHHKQTEIMEFQLSSSLPLQKQLWKLIIKRKISMQA